MHASLMTKPHSFLKIYSQKFSIQSEVGQEKGHEFKLDV